MDYCKFNLPTTSSLRLKVFIVGNYTGICKWKYCKCSLYLECFCFLEFFMREDGHESGEDYNDLLSVVYRACSWNIGTAKLIIGHGCPIIVSPLIWLVLQNRYSVRSLKQGKKCTRLQRPTTNNWCMSTDLSRLTKEVKSQLTVTTAKKWQTQYHHVYQSLTWLKYQVQ